MNTDYENQVDEYWHNAKDAKARGDHEGAEYYWRLVLAASALAEDSYKV